MRKSQQVQSKKKSALIGRKRRGIPWIKWRRHRQRNHYRQWRRYCRFRRYGHEARLVYVREMAFTNQFVRSFEIRPLSFRVVRAMDNLARVVREGSQC